MKQFLITVAGVLVGLILFLVVAPIVLISSIAGQANRGPTLPNVAVLEIDLREAMSDQPSSAALFGGPSLSTVEFIRRIEAAAENDKIKGLFIRANVDGMMPAQAEEIRSALATFKAAGKFIVAHAQYEGFSSLAGYAAVASADELWIPATSDVAPMGFRSEPLFFAQTLERFRIGLDVEARHEYKNAVNPFTESGFTDAHREATVGYLGSAYETLLAHIAADRKADVAVIRGAVEATPLTAEDAVARGLFTTLGEPEDAQAAALAKAGEDAELFPFEDYEPAPPSGPVIALVTGEGAVVPGPSDPSPFGGETEMNSDLVSEAFDDAIADEDVKAIVFRVSSPGGSVAASAQIGAAVARAQAAGKKVVVSMGELAASGGYWVSADADAIVALPTTLTGSIGIFAVVPAIGPAAEYYASVQSDEVSVGSPRQGMWSGWKPMDQAERAALAAMIDRGYEDFVTRVAAGRELTVDQVREIAKGRVWTGAQAKELRLVDELGGLNVAIAKAKELAGIAPDEDVSLKIFPLEKSLIEQIEELFGVGAGAAQAMAVYGALLGDEQVNAVLRQAIDARRGGLRARASEVEAVQ